MTDDCFKLVHMLCSIMLCFYIVFHTVALSWLFLNDFDGLLVFEPKITIKLSIATIHASTRCFMLLDIRGDHLGTKYIKTCLFSFCFYVFISPECL